MIILVSNDDGIQSEGIRCLETALASLGEVYTVAPDQEQSAVSHSLTLHRPLRIDEVGPRRFAVNGTPTDCVHLAVKGFLNLRPDVVVSGINKGPNLGDDVTYSGTVAAALEGALLGIPAIAVSLVTFSSPYRFEAAAEFSALLAEAIVGPRFPSDSLLNVNVPNLPRDRIRGYRYTRQGKRHYADHIEMRTDPRGRKYYWIGGDDLGFDPIEGSDCVAIHDDYISVTPLRGDLTHHAALDTIRDVRLAWE